MEFVLIGLLLLSFPIIAIVALVKSINLAQQLQTMEQRFEALERRLAGASGAVPAPPQPSPVPPPESAPSTAAMPPILAEPAPSAPVEPTPEPSAASPPEPPMRRPPPEEPAVTAEQPAQPELSFEERFGTRWTVWVGGLALALGGIFLVHYSIEQGLIGPKLRLFFGALLAAALIAAGERARRQENRTGFAGLPSAHIPSILTAAGTTVAYAVVYAAYALYGFLGPALAFVLLGAVALATLAAALLHGPWLAALGVAGAYVTPLLIASAEPNYWALYVYLAVVSAAAFALARIRLWRWLAFAAVGFGIFWVLPGMHVAHVDALGAHLFHVAVGFALVTAMIVSGLLFGPPADPGRIDSVSSLALSVYLIGALLLVLASRHDPAALTVFTALVATTVVISWRAEAAAAALPVAAALAALMIARWAFDAEIAGLIAAPGSAGEAAPQPWRADLGPHLALGFGFAALFGLSGYLAQGRSDGPIVPLLWSASGMLAPLLILIALYWRIAGFERSIPFAGVALLLAALNGLATEQLSKRTPRPGLAAAEALYATGAISALALALTFSLEKGWLTIALALMVPGIAWIAERRPLPMLRWLAAAVVALVMARVAWEPRIVGSDVGTTPIFNWLLYGYGVPTVAFWYAGHLLRKRADDQPARMVDAAAILFTVLFASLQIRHLTNNGDIYGRGGGLAELGLQVCVGLAMAIGLERLRERTKSIVHDAGALIIAALTATAIVLGLFLAGNPLFTGEPVGGAFINLILLGYAMPAILAIALALQTRHVRPQAYRICAAVLSIGLALAYLMLEVRRLYHGPVLSRGPTTDAEQWTYSVVLLAFGVVLLLAGIALRSQPARLASAAVTMIAVAKVFLFDMADLTGIWRALSFIGLGLVLVGTGWLYQRLLFPARRPASEAASRASAPTT